MKFLIKARNRPEDRSLNSVTYILRLTKTVRTVHSFSQIQSENWNFLLATLYPQSHNICSKLGQLHISKYFGNWKLFPHLTENCSHWLFQSQWELKFLVAFQYFQSQNICIKGGQLHIIICYQSKPVPTSHWELFPKTEKSISSPQISKKSQ